MGSSLTLLAPGTEAPDFDFQDSEGRPGHTRSLRGTPFLVYFYPRDNTPGCTREACALRDRYSDLQKAGLTVIGVSGDDSASHDRFRRKHRLPFPLAADTDHAIARAYGAWGEKQFLGKRFEGTHRVSFLVGSDGKILRVYPNVKPAEHAEEVLDHVTNL